MATIDKRRAIRFGFVTDTEDLPDDATGPVRWWRRPPILWTAGSVAAVLLAIPGVILFANDPGVATYQLNQILLIPLVAIILYGLHRLLPLRVQWVAAWLIAPFGPIAYLIWPNEQWWNYGALTVLPLFALAIDRAERIAKERGGEQQSNYGGWADGPWGPP